MFPHEKKYLKSLLTLSSVVENVHCNLSGCPQELSQNTLWKYENKVSLTGVESAAKGEVKMNVKPSFSAITCSLEYYTVLNIHSFLSYWFVVC